MGPPPAALLAVLLVLQAEGGPGGAPAVNGTVSDGVTGRPVGGAVVSFADPVLRAVTDASGRYAFDDVPPGARAMRVWAAGYAERELEALVPEATPLVLHVVLEPRPIPVRGLDVRPPPLWSLDRSRGPPEPDLEARPDLAGAGALLAEPDAFLSLSGAEVTVDPDLPQGVHVRGGAADHTAFVLDGLPVLSPYHGPGVLSAWNPDALGTVELVASAPPPALPHALAGTVAGATRIAPRTEVRGALSTAQLRATVSSPLAGGDAGVLVSGRTTVAGALVPDPEASYLGSGASDWIGALHAPLAGGRVRVLHYASEDELDAAAAPSPTPGSQRHTFEWEGRTTGVTWRRPVGHAEVEVGAWSARILSGARWRAPSSPLLLSSYRRDEGAAVSVESGRPAARSSAGLRVERIRAAYAAGPGDDGEDGAGGDPASAAPRALGVTTLWLRHVRVLEPGRVDAGLSASLAAGAVRLEPRLRLSWTPSPGWSVSASAARLHQFAQSLRNPESPAGVLLPVDLWVAARDGGVPVAEGDQVGATVDAYPGDGVRLTARGWLRRSRGLALAAPRTGSPFSADGFAPGSATARGASVEAATRGARYGALLSYGLQRVRVRWEGGSYAPRHGDTHLVEAAAVVLPATGLAIRAGVVGRFGRRGTPLSAEVEWEGCSALDGGCEFAGSPSTATDRTGAVALPAYLRLDVGARKEWRPRLLGRRASVALYGTLTNVLDRANVLAWVVDPETGERSAVRVRPFAPLVLGLDWRY